MRTIEEIKALEAQHKKEIEAEKAKKEELKKLTKLTPSTVRNKPVEVQKRLAAEIEEMLIDQMAREKQEQGYLSELTRKWIKDLNEILNSIHRNLYGDKTTNVNVDVNYSHIAREIRRYNQQ